MTAQLEVRCHRCSKYIGEHDEPLEFIGVTKDRELHAAIPTPRRTWLCKCGWYNVFRSAA